MRTYIVTTQSYTEGHLLHSSYNDANAHLYNNNRGVAEFRADNLATAREVFNIEVAQLTAEDRRGEIVDPAYEWEASRSVFCSITSIDEDGEVEIVEESNPYYIY